MGKAQKKTGKGRLDKYYKLAKYVECIPFALQALEYILQRPRVPCTFRIQADPVEQEIRLLGIRAMLYRSVRCARGMAPGCEQDNAREQSDRWCVEKL
jgi:hypothetical protein